MSKLTTMRIFGVALLLFSAVLLGVGMHHLVRTGTCSSTGYSANLGPVPHCPSGTGWWMAFLFGGIFGCLAGAALAGSLALVFASIFGAIGFGALSIVFDSSASSGAKLFGAIFGACFALVGVAAGIAVIASALSALREDSGSSPPRRPPPQPVPSSALGGTDAAQAFGAGAKSESPVSSTTTVAPAPASPAGPSPLGLVPGLQAVAQQRGAAAAGGGDVAGQLAKMAELHKRGELSDEEFAAAKAKLLEQL